VIGKIVIWAERTFSKLVCWGGLEAVPRSSSPPLTLVRLGRSLFLCILYEENRTRWMIRYRCPSVQRRDTRFEISKADVTPPFLNENIEIASFNILSDNTFYNLVSNLITICIIFRYFIYFPRVCAVHCKSALRPLF